jgi:hypothetical protein
MATDKSDTDPRTDWNLDRTFRAHEYWKRIGWITMVGFLVIAGAVISLPYWDRSRFKSDEARAGVCRMAVFAVAAAGVSLFVGYRNHRMWVRVTDAGIESQGQFLRRYIAWPQLRQATLYGPSDSIELRSSSGWICIGYLIADLRGLNDLLRDEIPTRAPQAKLILRRWY